uniref:Cysteine-rich PDZ-binding protein n=1 Tax=Lynx canadensis TaxID=61383 RepID=A0A667GYE1_LYNCA
MRRPVGAETQDCTANCRSGGAGNGSSLASRWRLIPPAAFQVWDRRGGGRRGRKWLFVTRKGNIFLAIVLIFSSCCSFCGQGNRRGRMVCEKCEKKLGTVITPDTWKDGARNTTESGGRKLNENKALTSKKARFDPYGKNKFSTCRICKSSVHQPGSHYCQGCAYKKGKFLSILFSVHIQPTFGTDLDSIEKE